MKLSELRVSSTLHGWDPLRLVAQVRRARRLLTAQMAALQAIHYILLAAFVPPLLAIWTHRAALQFEGGPAQVGMVLDWREFASQPTWDWDDLKGLVNLYTGWMPGAGTSAPTPQWTPAEAAAVANWTAGALWVSVPAANGTHTPLALPSSAYAWNSSERAVPPDAPSAAPTGVPNPHANSVAQMQEAQLERWEWAHTHDARRGWAIAVAWALTAVFDVQALYYLVRKPTHMLDFAASLHLFNLVITSLYAGSLPISLFWWAAMFVHGSLCVVLAERFAIQREMRG
ncbi:hypothetical protein MSPP1_003538 [Malassezia sp. CBS 17886]|nr:hypothetical protein MSPP1_003538 [Malassezia sp. CBS 17886]